MVDPLAEVVTHLQPQAPLSKVVDGAGTWRVRRTQAGEPFFCAVVDGACRLRLDDQEPVVLQAGDFVLIPAAYDFEVTSVEPPSEARVDTPPVAQPDGTIRLGRVDGRPDVRLLVGHCVFGSPDSALLVSLLPQLVHVRGEWRLATLVRLVGDESRAWRPARDVVLERLLEVLLIEALRLSSDASAAQGLLKGLADERLASAIRRLHESPDQPWTVEALAKEAALSRSAFFDRFSRAMGLTPMAYLLAWRMALAKNFLRKDRLGVAEVAERVGYSSASTFSVAFTRYVGSPPARYARAPVTFD